MDNRVLDNSIHQPQPAQRAVSQTGLQYHKTPARTGLPSRLSAVRSISQPINVLDPSRTTRFVELNHTTPATSNHDGLVLSPDVIEVQADAHEPPAKRPKTTGNSFRADEITETDLAHETHGDHAHHLYPGSPLPVIPKNNLTKPRMRKNRGQNERAEPARRAHGAEPPSMGVRIPNAKGVADFSPWTGRDHPEDVMNEAVVKNGHFDKGSTINATDSGSAKQSIWPNLSQKNNTGLQMVAYLFTQVLEKRQGLGKCTSTSTFKPPPRVTVTDSRREAWLRDLANPDVPLRKQSRTIPHGIRGKGLMDQCLGKQIPLQRAVWLAKCVGANELRAFKRKGVSGSAATSGECKWVRDWTVQIEQFLDGIITTCGQPGWQTRMNYAVKLATSFFVEKLMDADHYLDWIVTSLGEAPIERLPIWLIMTQLYWKDITSYVRRGRKLAEHLLDRLCLLKSVASTAGRAMYAQLQKLITILATTKRGCLIVPTTWEKFKHVFTSKALPNNIDGPFHIMQDVLRRNDRLTEPLRKTAANTRSKLLDLYTSLDSVGLDLNIDHLTAQLLSLVPDILDLVPAILNWASSPYRQGQSRVYLAASIIAQLHTSQHEIETTILTYISSLADTATPQIDNIHRVVVDLVRRRAFSIGKYLRWLISSGVLYDSSKSACATALLPVLPTDLLPSDLWNTRATLLRRLGIQDLIDTQHLLSHVNLEAVLDGEDEDLTPFEYLAEPPTLASKMHVATDIRRIIRRHNKHVQIGTAAFCAFRTALELMQDPPTILDLVMMTIDSDDTTLLASVADTINYHADTFAAMGQLGQLVDRMTDRYRTLRSVQAQDRPFICGMLALATRTSGKNSLQKLIENDLMIYEQQTLLAACSPASDNLTSMHASSLGSENDIDAVFASGNIMDHQLMQRVFARIVQYATKSSHSQFETPSKLYCWFSQLRLLDSSGFKQLANAYLQDFFKATDEKMSRSEALIALIASDCCSLAEVVRAAQEASSFAAAKSATMLILSDQNICTALSAVERYRYKVMAQTFQDTQHNVMVDLIHELLKDCSVAEMESMSRLLVDYLNRNTTAMNQFMERSKQDPMVQPNVDHLCLMMLKRGSPGQATDALDSSFIISLANPLSIEICAWLLHSPANHGGSRTQESSKAIEEILIKIIDDGNCIWPQLVDSVDNETRKSLHGWAQDQLLIYATGSSLEEDAAIREVIQRYLDVIGITHSAVQDEDDTHLIVALAEKLKGVEKRLSDVKFTLQNGNELRGAIRSLHLFLNICILHVHHNIDHEDSRQARGDLLLALCSLHTLTSLQTQRDTLDFVFDLAATFAEGVTESSLSSTTRAGLINLLHDPNVASILGGMISRSSTTDTWLMLSSHPQTAQSSQQQQRSATFSRPSVRAAVSSPSQPQKSWPGRPVSTALGEPRITPFALRRWEIMPDATPVMGENDAGLSLGLFAARKV